MEVYSYICTRTHYIRDNFSVSLIYDVKHCLHYLLKGIGSNLWDIIVKYQNFDRIMSYARNNHLEKELSAILFELKKKEIINTDKTFEKSDYNYLGNAISFNSRHIKYFLDKWTKFTYNHGFIKDLVIELSYKCNLKCKHCYNHKNINEYNISFEQAKKAIDEAYNLGISAVRLTGGECTLNKDFLKICEYIKSRRLELFIYTNGQLFNDNEELFEKIVSLYPSLIQYSIYSMDSGIHDNITGVKGSWQKTINAIHKSINSKILVRIATPVLSYNKDSYKEITKFANSIGAIHINSCIFTNNPENNNLASKLSYDEIEQYHINKLNKADLRQHFKKDKFSICEAGSDRLCLTPKLDITPCISFDYVLGNLNSTTLAEIKKTTLKEFKKIFVRENLTECFNEEYCKYCRYCPDTSLLDNTFMKKRPILCENAKAYYNAVLYHKNKGE